MRSRIRSTPAGRALFSVAALGLVGSCVAQVAVPPMVATPEKRENEGANLKAAQQAWPETLKFLRENTK